MKPKILVVDDHESLRILLKDNLEYEGFEVACAASAHDALKLAWQFVPDIAIVDIGLPDVPGWDVCARIRGEKLTAHTEIVVLTAETKAKVVERMKTLGFVHYVPKPYNPVEMGALLKDLLAKKKGSAV